MAVVGRQSAGIRVILKRYTGSTSRRRTFAVTDERQIELDDEVRQGDVAPDAATESEVTPAAVSAQEPDTSFPDRQCQIV